MDNDTLLPTEGAVMGEDEDEFGDFTNATAASHDEPIIPPSQSDPSDELFTNTYENSTRHPEIEDANSNLKDGNEDDDFGDFETAFTSNTTNETISTEQNDISPSLPAQNTSNPQSNDEDELFSNPYTSNKPIEPEEPQNNTIIETINDASPLEKNSSPSETSLSQEDSSTIKNQTELDSSTQQNSNFNEAVSEVIENRDATMGGSNSGSRQIIMEEEFSNTFENDNKNLDETDSLNEKQKTQSPSKEEQNSPSDALIVTTPLHEHPFLIEDQNDATKQKTSDGADAEESKPTDGFESTYFLKFSELEDMNRISSSNVITEEEVGTFQPSFDDPFQENRSKSTSPSEQQDSHQEIENDDLFGNPFENVPKESEHESVSNIYDTNQQFEEEEDFGDFETAFQQPESENSTTHAVNSLKIEYNNENGQEEFSTAHSETNDEEKVLDQSLKNEEEVLDQSLKNEEEEVPSKISEPSTFVENTVDDDFGDFESAFENPSITAQKSESSEVPISKEKEEWDQFENEINNPSNDDVSISQPQHQTTHEEDWDEFGDFESTTVPEKTATTLPTSTSVVVEETPTQEKQEAPKHHQTNSDLFSYILDKSLSVQTCLPSLSTLFQTILPLTFSEESEFSSTIQSLHEKSQEEQSKRQLFIDANQFKWNDSCSEKELLKILEFEKRQVVRKRVVKKLKSTENFLTEFGGKQATTVQQSFEKNTSKESTLLPPTNGITNGHVQTKIEEPKMIKTNTPVTPTESTLETKQDNLSKLQQQSVTIETPIVEQKQETVKQSTPTTEQIQEIQDLSSFIGEINVNIKVEDFETKSTVTTPISSTPILVEQKEFPTTITSSVKEEEEEDFGDFESATFESHSRNPIENNEQTKDVSYSVNNETQPNFSNTTPPIQTPVIIYEDFDFGMSSTTPALPTMVPQVSMNQTDFFTNAKGIQAEANTVEVSEEEEDFGDFESAFEKNEAVPQPISTIEPTVIATPLQQQYENNEVIEEVDDFGSFESAKQEVPASQIQNTNDSILDIFSSSTMVTSVSPPMQLNKHAIVEVIDLEAEEKREQQTKLLQKFIDSIPDYSFMFE